MFFELTTMPGIYDEEHPPAQNLLADCVHCGFCLPACPTYVLWQKEMDSPRGRIHLMKVGYEEKDALTDGFVHHIDTCLGCMACVTACPSGVQYDHLIEATRQQVERNSPRSLGDRWFRRLIFFFFPYVKRLRWVALALWFYQKSGIQKLLQISGVLRLLPQRLQAMENIAPSISLRSIVEGSVKPLNTPRTNNQRVGLLLGCVQRVFFGEVNAATQRVLTAEGFEVVVPKKQECCGALMLHAGYEQEAAEMAKALIDAFENNDLDFVVANAAGCGSTLKDYGHLLRDDPVYASRAAEFSKKCKDISEILADSPSTAPRHPLPLRVAYHDACHLQHAQGVKAQPRAVLSSIPELDICEIPEGSLCCGSAGIYNLVEPEAARALGQRKANNIASTGADAIVSSNPGCLLQIQGNLDAIDQHRPQFHLVELIDASIRGVPLEKK
tara:strand:+ start:6451 stop:7776 length:1326 start_codon:yes stop_codon:yes gene_type:complete